MEDRLHYITLPNSTTKWETIVKICVTRLIYASAYFYICANISMYSGVKWWKWIWLPYCHENIVPGHYMMTSVILFHFPALLYVFNPLTPRQKYSYLNSGLRSSSHDYSLILWSPLHSLPLHPPPLSFAPLFCPLLFPFSFPLFSPLLFSCPLFSLLLSKSQMPDEPSVLLLCFIKCAGCFLESGWSHMAGMPSLIPFSICILDFVNHILNKNTAWF